MGNRGGWRPEPNGPYSRQFRANERREKELDNYHASERPPPMDPDSKKMSPTEWYAKNNLYCKNGPKIVTRLTTRLIDRLIKNEPVPDEKFV